MLASDSALLTASWITAGATFVLAIVTALLAWSTRKAAVETAKAAREASRSADIAEQDLCQGQELLKVSQAQVDAAQRQAEAATASLVAASRPVLVPALGDELPANQQVRYRCWSHASEVQRRKVGMWWIDQPTSVAWVMLALRNIGPGPAFLTRAPMELVLQLKWGEGVHGWSDSLVIGQDDCIEVTFADAHRPEEQAGCLAAMFKQASDGFGTEGSVVTAVIKYRDLAGNRAPLTHIRLQLRSNGFIEVRAVEMVSEEESAV